MAIYWSEVANVVIEGTKSIKNWDRNNEEPKLLAAQDCKVT